MTQLLKKPVTQMAKSSTKITTVLTPVTEVIKVDKIMEISRNSISQLHLCRSCTIHVVNCTVESIICRT